MGTRSSTERGRDGASCAHHARTIRGNKQEQAAPPLQRLPVLLPRHLHQHRHHRHDAAELHDQRAPLTQAAVLATGAVAVVRHVRKYKRLHEAVRCPDRRRGDTDADDEAAGEGRGRGIVQQRQDFGRLRDRLSVIGPPRG
eukprot:COSAG05_NODE_12618_length_461_cov_0.825967_1_plen_141_part_00